MMYGALFFLGIWIGISIADTFAGKDYPQRHHALAIMRGAFIGAVALGAGQLLHLH